MKYLLLTGICICCVSCRPAADIPKLSAGERVALVADAYQAERGFLQVELEKRDGSNVSKGLWGAAIRKLNPVRVVSDRANVKIVVVDSEHVEEGFYVSTPISSYLPAATDFSELTLLSEPADKAPGTLYRYRIAKPPAAVTPKPKLAARAIGR